ncbi:MAG: TIGR03790 family protein [Sedimentisphaerales bacterium]|nr:TIGR03790 family protein [Sedimentisphaerales bacterium]
MTRKILTALVLVATCVEIGWALEPDEILVIVNSDYPASVRLARYYCEKRGLPPQRIVPVSLGPQLRDSIGRDDYEKRLAHPIRRVLTTREDLSSIKCLLTTYGIPLAVGPRKPLSASEARLKELRRAQEQETEAIEQLEANGLGESPEHKERSRRRAWLQMELSRIMGAETGASVDSELSLVLFGAYELYRWQPNLLRSGAPQAIKTLMVCRLDGTDYGIAKGLVDKAIAAETDGLKGNAYIDSRGIVSDTAYGYYDQSLRNLAQLIRSRAALPVTEETTGALFAPGSCPQTALYCGWYSVRRYVDAFDFVEGAVGFHIASFEAQGLHDPNGSAWCTAMLRDGITATLGPVAEPYLHAFPEPQAFFGELLEGRCLVEAFYRTKPFNSWQLVLIGDPLYRPFKQR